MRHCVFPSIIFSLLLSATGGATSADAAVLASSEIVWHSCATNGLPAQECGELVVPLSDREPEGATITLAVARVPATDPASRIGSLFLNPGGPGGSGVLALPVQYGSLPGVLQERFDVIGFDTH